MSLRRGGIFLLATVFCVFLMREIWYNSWLSISFESQESAVFEVEMGESISEIARRLSEEGFLAAPEWVFLLYLQRKDWDTEVQSGLFFLPKNLTVPVLAESMRSASSRQIKVTLFPGWSHQDIDSSLSDLNLIQPGEWIDCIRTCNFSDFSFLPADPDLREGFFWADTYFVSPESFVVSDFAIRLLQTFDQKTKMLLNGHSRNGFDILRMASLIEKESGNTFEERRMVSGILWKRLDAGWLLGVDATTRYAQKNFSDSLTIAQLSEKNPWNTRAVLGLPPGPIAAPSLDSLRAAVDPLPSSFWFYLHGADGKIHYAETEQQHEVNKDLFL